MQYKIVFSDVDGTLLDSKHKVLPGTMAAIRALQRQGIPFVIISARSPSGIYPILEENQFNCPVIAYSGALILDENRKVLGSVAMSQATASEVLSYIEERRLDCSWNIYSMDTWIAKDKKDPRVMQEAEIVRASVVEGTMELLRKDQEVHKLLCMCNPKHIVSIERQLKEAFPGLSIAKSSDVLLEIMPGGVTKRSAMTRLCELWKIPLESTVAFGDNYNDVEMLETAGLAFLMGNAPEELKGRFSNVTGSNDQEGIWRALVSSGIVDLTSAGSFSDALEES